MENWILLNVLLLLKIKKGIHVLKNAKNTTQININTILYNNLFANKNL